MSDVNYKHFTEEESKIYDSTVLKIRVGLKNGLDFREACSAARVEDEELMKFIEADALKIMIAELHYGRGITLQEVADVLKVPLREVNNANSEMIEDAGITAAEAYRKDNPDAGPVGNA